MSRRPGAASGQLVAGGIYDHLEGDGLDGLEPDAPLNSWDLGGGPRSHGPKLEKISKWSSLFGIKPKGKSTLPPVKNISNISQGNYTISIPAQIIDHNIARIESTLIGKFFGARPNIEVVRGFIKRKWNLKG